MTDEALRVKLPIGQHEKILLTVKHHWFAYISIMIGAGFICLVLFACLIGLKFQQASFGINDKMMDGIVAIGLFMIGSIAVIALVPVWLKQQEMLILTEESLMQYNKPTIFTSKVSQLNLQHVADVTVKQDAIGSMLGYGHIAVETPGEQDNYEFNVLAQPNIIAKAIVEAHENYAAALESGQIQTTLGRRAPVPGNAWRSEPPVANPAPETPSVEPLAQVPPASPAPSPEPNELSGPDIPPSPEQ